MSKSLDSLPLAMRNRATWLINAGIDDTKRTLETMTGSEDEIRILQAAVADETAGQNRSSRLKPITAALKRFGAAVPVASTELDAIKASLEAHRGKLVEQEEAFFHASLPSRLKMGLQCLKAHALFAVPTEGRKGVGGRIKKNCVTRDTVSGPGGFEGWLSDEVPWLKRPTAYKYMTAVKGLAIKGVILDETATEEDVDHALKVTRAVAQDMGEAAPTLASLIAAATEPVAPQQLPPPPAQQQEFDFLKTKLTHFREETEGLIALKDQLEGLPDLKRAAVARVYNLLHSLTGSHWAPSDEPDELASIDPDIISLQ